MAEDQSSSNEKRSEFVRQTLKKLSTGISGSTLDLAELLWECQENNYAPLFGYKNTPEYAEKELGLKPSKARYLAKIVRVYRAVGLNRKVCEHIATSKLREISRLNPKGSFWNRDTKLNEPLDEHIVRLITEADELTVAKIKEEVLRLQGLTGPDKRIMRTYNTSVSAYENIIKPALEMLRRKLGSAGRDDEGNAKEYTDGDCIEAACMDILSDPNYREPLELPMEKL